MPVLEYCAARGYRTSAALSRYFGGTLFKVLAWTCSCVYGSNSKGLAAEEASCCSGNAWVNEGWVVGPYNLHEQIQRLVSDTGSKVITAVWA